MDKREGNRGGSAHPELPVSSVVDRGIPTARRLLAFVAGIRHPNDGAVDPNNPAIQGPMKVAEGADLDVVLLPGSQHTVVVVGRWIADHPRLVKIAAGTVLTTAIVAGALGFILRAHHREPLKK